MPRVPESPPLAGPRGRRRGPLPGATEKYAASDRALFPEIERLLGEGVESLRSATTPLVASDRVEGTGNGRSLAERLAARFRKERG